MSAIDVGIVMRRLQETGWTHEAANSMYGQLTGMAGPLINFPQVLTQAVAMSLVPAVAAAYKQKDMTFLRENVQVGLRMSIIIRSPLRFWINDISRTDHAPFISNAKTKCSKRCTMFGLLWLQALFSYLLFKH